MIYANISDAKTHLSRYIKRALAGERVVLCDRNKPMIEFTVIASDYPQKKKRKIGLGEGQYKLPDNFNDPLPPEDLALFYTPLEL